MSEEYEDQEAWLACDHDYDEDGICGSCGNGFYRELDYLKEEAERLRSALVDMVIQFAYQNRDGLLITGGLSALEDAFDALRIDEKTDPYSLLQPKGQSCSLTDP